MNNGKREYNQQMHRTSKLRLLAIKSLSIKNKGEILWGK